MDLKEARFILTRSASLRIQDLFSGGSGTHVNFSFQTHKPPFHVAFLL